MGIRLLKVNESIREIVSSELVSINDPRRGFVTVTGVETSADLRHAKVFVSVLGKQKDRDASLTALRAAHGLLQSRVAAALRMKRTPQLEFVYDETVDTAMRVEGLIRRYEAEIAARPPRNEADGDEASGDHELPAAGTPPESTEEV
jgi:ribosome-binding factor A